MQYSLKTLMLIALILALITAAALHFGGIGVLYALVAFQVIVIGYGFTQIPLRSGIASLVLMAACLTHIATLYFYYPLAEQWANRAMYAAADRGYQIQMDEDEFHGMAMGVMTLVFGYVPIGMFVLFIRLILLDPWKWIGVTRLLASLALLMIPFFVAWLCIRHYTNY